MEPILDHLKQHTIISSQYVQALQQTLIKEHPDLTSLQRAQLFAQTLHRILDDALSPFDSHLQKHLKYTLLRQTLYKEGFSINAFDIFNAYTQLDRIETDAMNHLVIWINNYLQHPLSLENVEALMTSFNQQTEAEHLVASSIDTDFVALLTDRHRHLLLGLLFFITIGLSSLYINMHVHEGRQASISKLINTDIQLPIALDLAMSANYMQPDLQYQDFDKKALQSWLEEKKSLLVTEPYFSTIIETAEAFNINPLLLFSITGQEQNFVPTTHNRAVEIANNPFNLFGSWKNYNTSIEESSRIVSRTLINLGKDCPKDEDQIKWINKAYAADPNWHLGVTYFFNELQVATTLANTSFN